MRNLEKRRGSHLCPEPSAGVVEEHPEFGGHKGVLAGGSLLGVSGQRPEATGVGHRHSTRLLQMPESKMRTRCAQPFRRKIRTMEKISAGDCRCTCTGPGGPLTAGIVNVPDLRRFGSRGFRFSRFSVFISSVVTGSVVALFTGIGFQFGSVSAVWLFRFP